MREIWMQDTFWMASNSGVRVEFGLVVEVRRDQASFNESLRSGTRAVNHR